MIKARRGHLYLADLNPPKGTEPGKIRPVLVVQTNLLNPKHPSTIVCPATTQVIPESRYLRLHLKAGMAGLNQDSDILVDQIRAIDNRRLLKELGRVPAHLMEELSVNLLIVLELRFIA